jgi:hypothetical protein
VLPVILVLIAGAFEGASFSLLIPLTDAVADDSFGFLEESRAFGWILELVPGSLADSPSRDAFLIVVTVGLIILGRMGKLVFEYVRKLYVVRRTEAYRVAVGDETFGRVLSFGRQYFDRQSIGSCRRRDRLVELGPRASHRRGGAVPLRGGTDREGRRDARDLAATVDRVHRSRSRSSTGS